MKKIIQYLFIYVFVQLSSMTNLWSLNDAPVNVLCIDGGGVRGIIPAVILAKIEKDTNQTIAKIFDVIVGTSTGGLLALALTIPRNNGGELISSYTAENLVDFYINESKKIFPKKGICQRLSSLFSTSFYDPKPFEEIAKNLVKETKIKDLITCVGITATNANTCAPRTFRSDKIEDHEYLARDVARATSAAPTYFPPAIINRESFCDGGVGRNNPARDGLMIARERYPGRPIRLISIGTGHTPTYEETRNVEKKCIPCWVKKVIEMDFAVQDRATDASLNVELTENSYARINVLLTEEQMAMDNPDNVEGLKITTENYLRDNRDLNLQRALEWCNQRANMIGTQGQAIQGASRQREPFGWGNAKKRDNNSTRATYKTKSEINFAARC
ncbi:MAG: hypothetical protein HEEMFOPI_01267 [Holosporales bacterium]